MGDSYHVVRSEQDIFMARGNLAGSGMLRFPAIAAGPRRASGPNRAPDSGDDTEFRGGPPFRAAEPIKVRADPPLSLSALPRLPLKLDFDSAYCRHHLDSASSSAPTQR